MVKSFKVELLPNTKMSQFDIIFRITQISSGPNSGPINMQHRERLTNSFDWGLNQPSIQNVSEQRIAIE